MNLKFRKKEVLHIKTNADISALLCPVQLTLTHILYKTTRHIGMIFKRFCKDNLGTAFSYICLYYSHFTFLTFMWFIMCLLTCLFMTDTKYAIDEMRINEATLSCRLVKQFHKFLLKIQGVFIDAIIQFFFG